MKQIFKVFGVVTIYSIFAFSINSSAYAIQCNEDSQVQNDGTEVITPYCQDNYLGEVARGYGIKIKNAELRDNPNKKEAVCLAVGEDNRLTSICDTNLNKGPDTQ